MDDTLKRDPSAEGLVDATPSEGPDPGPLGRVLGVFIHPKKTFESMRARPRFLLALVLVIAVQMVLAFFVFRSGVPAEEAIAKMEAQGQDVRSIEAVQAFFEGTPGMILVLVGAPFAMAIHALAGSALLFFMGNLMLGARLRFNHYLSATAYGMVVMLVDQCVRVPLIVTNRTTDVRLGLGNLFADNTGLGIRALDSLTDPLLLWSSAVCAIGVATYARRDFKFGALAALPGMILAALFTAAR